MVSKKAQAPRHERHSDTLSEENHMQVFARLAAVKNMHGTPGDRKPKGK